MRSPDNLDQNNQQNFIHNISHPDQDVDNKNPHLDHPHSHVVHHDNENPARKILQHRSRHLLQHTHHPQSGNDRHDAHTTRLL